jgi:thiamine-monophosphate kinase
LQSAISRALFHWQTTPVLPACPRVFCPILFVVPGKRIDPATSGSLGEMALIIGLRNRSTNGARSGLRLGIGDDCALLRTRPNEEVAVTTDLSIAGRHFRLDWHPPESAGHRALARGLSDLAAMGARPLAAFLSLGLPRELTLPASRRVSFTWMSRFLDGLLALAAEHKTPLAGGDLAESPLAVADIVLVGGVPRGRALLRSGARPGDLLYVTGALGGSAAALERLEKLAGKIPKRLESALAPQLYPQPRIAQGLWLQRHGAASVAIDLSDGLSTDLAHICEESGVAAEVDAALLPIHPAATLAQALNGGEDYELLFTATPSARLPRFIAGVPVTRIGRILKSRSGRPAVALLTAQGSEPLEPHGWQHFS